MKYDGEGVLNWQNYFVGFDIYYPSARVRGYLSPEEILDQLAQNKDISLKDKNATTTVLDKIWSDAEDLFTLGGALSRQGIAYIGDFPAIAERLTHDRFDQVSLERILEHGHITVGATVAQRAMALDKQPDERYAWSLIKPNLIADIGFTPGGIFHKDPAHTTDQNNCMRDIHRGFKRRMDACYDEEGICPFIPGITAVRAMVSSLALEKGLGFVKR